MKTAFGFLFLAVGVLLAARFLPETWMGGMGAAGILFMFAAAVSALLALWRLIRRAFTASPPAPSLPRAVPQHVQLPKVRSPSPVTTAKGPYLAADITVDVLIRYRSNANAISERLITVRQLIGTLHRDRTLTLDRVVAYCHLRSDARTFVLSGVVHAAVPDTGEVIDDFPQWLAVQCGRQEPVRGVVPA